MSGDICDLHAVAAPDVERMVARDTARCPAALGGHCLTPENDQLHRGSQVTRRPWVDREPGKAWRPSDLRNPRAPFLGAVILSVRPEFTRLGSRQSRQRVPLQDTGTGPSPSQGRLRPLIQPLLSLSPSASGHNTLSFPDGICT